MIKKILLITIYCLFFPVLAIAADGVLVDASGSMKGFFITQKVHEVYNQIVDAAGGQVKGYCFKNRGQLFVYSPEELADGTVTRLDASWQVFRRRYPTIPIVWIITDNIQDPEGDKEDVVDIARFYAELRRPEVKQVFIFPGKLPFQGMIYGRDGRTRLGDYQGLRGLIVYAVLLDNNQRARFEAQVKSFAQQSQWPAILSKPLECELSIEEAQSTNIPSSRFFIYQPNRHAFQSKSVFGAEEPLKANLKLRLRSNLKYIQIRKLEVKVDFVDDPQSPFRGEDSEVKYQPRRLSKLTPEDSIREILISLTVKKGVSFSKNPMALLRYAFSRSPGGEYCGNISVTLVAQSDQVELMNEVWRRYGTNDPAYFERLTPELQEHIFGLDRLFKGVFSDFQQSRPTILAAKTYLVCFFVRKPIWPVFAVIGVVLLFMGLIGLVAYVRSKPRSPKIQYFLTSSSPGIYDFSFKTRLGKKEDNSPITAVPLPKKIWHSLEEGWLFLLPLLGPVVIARKHYRVDGKRIFKRLSASYGHHSFTLKAKGENQKSGHTPRRRR